MGENVSHPAELYWHSVGEGPDVVLVHGWGMNGAVWEQTVQALAPFHRVHVVDLPGYGHSAHCHAESLEEMAQWLLPNAPKQAIWIGWSLGGLVATHMALYHANYVRKLVTVASSPKFAAHSTWRGIQPQVLTAFTQQLAEDFQTTIERFMALQAMGSPTARQDVKQIKQAVLSRPAPNLTSLLAGLTMLANVDLRDHLSDISVPFLRLYGRLDGLVPVKVAQATDKLTNQSESYIFNQSSHAPFMTEADTFCQKILQFSR